MAVMSTEEQRARRRARYQERLEVLRARRRAIYAANSEAHLAYQAEYRRTHPQVVERQRALDAANAEHIRARRRAYYDANVDQIKARQAAYAAAHPEVHRRANKKYRVAHPERVREIKARRRAAAALVEKVDYAAILKRDGLVCHLCRQQVQGRDLAFDHVIPIARGGPHAFENIRVAHHLCNSRKGTRLLEELDWIPREVAA